MTEEYLTIEGLRELEKQDVINHGAIMATAILLAAKEGRRDVDEVHIKKASKSLSRLSQSSSPKWFLAITTTVLLGLALFQMELIATSSLSMQLSLWLLPLFSIAWVIVIVYYLRDFL